MTDYSGTITIVGVIQDSRGDHGTFSASLTEHINATLDQSGNGVATETVDGTLDVYITYANGTHASGTVPFDISTPSFGFSSGQFKTTEQVPSQLVGGQFGVTLSGAVAADQHTITESTNGIFSANYQGVSFTGTIYGSGTLTAPYAPSVTGIPASDSTTDSTLVSPFQNFLITDRNAPPSDTVTITLSNPTNGILRAPDGGSFNATTGVFTVTGTPAEVTAAVNAVVFVPTLGQAAAGQAVTTNLAIAAYDTAGSSIINGSTSIVATSTGRTLATLGTFDQTNGGYPSSGLIMDAAGDLFGTTWVGGTNGYNLGTVFEFAKTAGGYSSAPITVASFDVTCRSPIGNLIIDSAGNLFGTAGGGADGEGSVFEISRTSGGFATAPIVIASFNGAGAFTNSSLVADSAGDLFGTTSVGGSNYNGAIYEIVKTSSGFNYNPVILASLTTSLDSYPTNSLFIDSSGNLFGDLPADGANGQGSVFELQKSNGAYNSQLTTIASFDGIDGAAPLLDLVEDTSGDLFGTTASGGAHNDGGIFEIVKTGDGYSATPILLASFNSNTGGASIANLIIDAKGNLFGATGSGGGYGGGTLWELAASGGTYANTPTILASLTLPPYDSGAPQPGLTVDSSGNLFITTHDYGAVGGEVFELSNTGYQTRGNPLLTSTRNAIVGQGIASVLPGIVLSEVGAIASETFTVKLSDSLGLLSATGAGITGSGTTSLTITGSLAQVSADLLTLTIKEAHTGSDTITLSATDDMAGVGRPVAIGVTINGPPVAVSPFRAIISKGVGSSIAGFSLAEAGNVAGETFTVQLTDKLGLLAATGAGVNGSGTNSLAITGSFAQVNAALATLTETASSTGSDTITLSASDSLGGVARSVSTGVIVNGPPAIIAPYRSIISQGVTAAIKGLAIHESGDVVGETFTLSLTDASGLLVASGAGVSGSGTGNLTITGTYAQVNADLKTVTDTEVAAGSDTITLTASDSLGGIAATSTIAVTVDGLPVVAAPTNVVLAQGVSAAISGVALHQSGIVVGETFTIKLSDASGLLSASGAGVSGSGTTSLTISGSYAQVVADLKTLTDKGPTAGSDTITISTSDSLGGVGAPVFIAVTINGAPVVSAPFRALTSQGIADAITGVSLNESGSTTGDIFTVKLADTLGLLAATGAGVSGSGTTSLTITGSYAQVNVALATLADTESTTGSDIITVSASDSLGGVARPVSIGVTVNGPPTIAAPLKASLTRGVPTTIGGVALRESGNVVGETFTLTLSDTSGLLGATGAGVAGSGTTSLTISGSYAQVNADLKTLTDTTSAAGSDVITLTASDSLGAKAAPVSIAVTVTGAPGGAANISLFAQAAAFAGAQAGVGAIGASPLQTSGSERAALAATLGARTHLS